MKSTLEESETVRELAERETLESVASTEDSASPWLGVFSARGQRQIFCPSNMARKAITL